MKPFVLLNFVAAVVAVVAMVASPTVRAHDRDPDAKGPNGGQLRQAGAYDYELVVPKDCQAVKENPLSVYVTVHDQGKAATAGATGSATILAAKIKVTTELRADGDNRVMGLAKYACSSDMKVVVSIALKGQSAEQARFTPLAKTGQ